MTLFSFLAMAQKAALAASAKAIRMWVEPEALVGRCVSA